MSLQYQNPLHIVRGHEAYLIDQNGQKYLDTVNNVGSCRARTCKSSQSRSTTNGVLNTNTRYLHLSTRAAKALIDTLPKGLEVVHFVNSGSEANELALEWPNTLTGSKRGDC